MRKSNTKLNARKSIIELNEKNYWPKAVERSAVIQGNRLREDLRFVLTKY